MDILLIFPNSFRRGAPPRHEGRAPPRGRDGFPGPEDFGPEENFDASDELSKSSPNPPIPLKSLEAADAAATACVNKTRHYLEHATLENS